MPVTTAISCRVATADQNLARQRQLISEPVTNQLEAEAAEFKM
ncbi:hypothetical protein [Halocatena marina]